MKVGASDPQASGVAVLGGRQDAAKSAQDGLWCSYERATCPVAPTPMVSRAPDACVRGFDATILRYR